MVGNGKAQVTGDEKPAIAGIRMSSANRRIATFGKIDRNTNYAKGQPNETNNQQPDWHNCPLSRRIYYIIFDSLLATNPPRLLVFGPKKFQD
ncbi:MAG: hypothetical protein WC451_03755 [Patescibacteria group bacterium]|jgi:hypothetical protein